MFWNPSSFPRCTSHLFLSHSGEDREPLVWPVYEVLKGRGIVPWLDREDYHYGRDSRSALRDAVLRCRHTVFFVTRHLLRSGRGWCVLELAYAELLQESLNRPGGVWANVILPLFFVARDDADLLPTVWNRLSDRGSFHDPRAGGDPATWAVGQIVRFLRDEQRIAAEHDAEVGSSREEQERLGRPTGLQERVIRFDPCPLAFSDTPAGQ